MSDCSSYQRLHPPDVALRRPPHVLSSMLHTRQVKVRNVSKRHKSGSKLWWWFLGLLLVLAVTSGLGRCIVGSFTYTTFRLLDRAQRFNRYYAGRTELLDSSPKCCFAEDCFEKDRGRHAIITSLRTDRYLPLVQELACSVKRTNPHIPFYVYTVRGDLSPFTEEAVRLFAELRYWSADLRMPSYTQDGRFELNWIKLRAWELTEFDALLMLDSDMTVLSNLSYVFQLPTPFAAAADQVEMSPAFWFGTLGRLQAGLLFVRPCRAVAEHMIALAQQNRLLQFQFDYAEQEFLDWYFKFDRFLLPLDYNSVVPITIGNRTFAGNTAKVIHFTHSKPFTRDLRIPQHRFLCSALEAQHRELLEADPSDCLHRKLLPGGGAAAKAAALAVEVSQQQ